MNRAEIIAAADLSLLVGRRRAAQAVTDPEMIAGVAEALAVAHCHYVAAGLGRRAAVLVRFVRRLSWRWADHAAATSRRRRSR
ncbi:MAG: hypothetical protein LW698_03830 [Planctomycetaceae bacterium]|jgi:hypothetical protein|nr:hypothetical protein [Planctomycetaceae bacterium]